MCLFKLSFLLNLPLQILQVKLASVSFLRMLLISPCLLYICLFKLSRLVITGLIVLLLIIDVYRYLRQLSLMIKAKQKHERYIFIVT